MSAWVQRIVGADSFLIEEMRRYNQVSSFDEQPMPDLNSEAIDFRVASEFFKPIRKLTPHGLQSLKLTTSYQGRIVPAIRGSPSIRRCSPEAFSQMRGSRSDGSRVATVAEYSIRQKYVSYLPGAAEEVTAFLGNI